MAKLAKRARGTCMDIDYLDRLPDELLSHIVSLLPFKEAVRTSILSKRWRYLYASISNLNFNFSEGRTENSVGFANVVDNLFSFRKRCLVDKLYLSRSVSADLQPLQVEKWIEAAMWHGIRELDLDVPFTVNLPASLFTSETLEVLKLEAISHSDKEFKSSDSRFEVPAKVSLPCLKFLFLLELPFSDDDALNRIVSNCPVLEMFVCNLWENDRKLSVCSTTLKSLCIQFLCSRGWSGSFDLVVDVPNIEFLQYTAWGVTSQNIAVGPSLVKVNYNFQQYYGDCRNYIPNAAALLRSISSIRSLILTENILYDLLLNAIPLPVFGNLSHLVVRRCRHGLGSLPNFLARCESLEVLDVVSLSKWSRDRDPWLQLEQSNVSCLTSHLKTINFYMFRPGEDQIEAVNYFLKTARVLKKMAITCPWDVDGELMLGMRNLIKVSNQYRVRVCRDHELVATLI